MIVLVGMRSTLLLMLRRGLFLQMVPRLGLCLP